MKKTYEIFSGKDLEVAELILRRRMQMLVHSYIYYKMNDSLITDREFDMWGRELVKLQADYPDIASQVEYAEAFSDWDASTGFNLPVNEQIIRIAYRLTHKTTANTETKPKQVTKSKVKNSARKSLF
jgi:hypothetical protein